MRVSICVFRQWYEIRIKQGADMAWSADGCMEVNYDSVHIMFLRSTLFITCRIEFLWAIKRSFKSVHVHWNPLREGLYVGITSMIKANMKSPGKQQKCDVVMTNNSEINGVFFSSADANSIFLLAVRKKIVKGHLSWQKILCFNATSTARFRNGS